MADVTEAGLALAKRRFEAEREERPVAEGVAFDPASERVTVAFTNGASFAFPARALQGLQEADAEALAVVTLLGETGLHWERLDVDYSIAGLMKGIFGTRAFMEGQRRGGQSRSTAKSAASRANGRLGGRPRKTSSPA